MKSDFDIATEIDKVLKDIHNIQHTIRFTKFLKKIGIKAKYE